MEPSRQAGVFFFFLLILGISLSYYGALTTPFIFDDFQGVLRNPNVQDLSSPLKIFQNPEGGGMTGSRPLSALTLAVDYALCKDRVLGYHLTNLAIHLMATLALYGLLRRTLELPFFAPRFGAGAQELACGATLFWSLHPLQTESVTYIASRTELLMGLFYLLTLYCFVRGIGNPSHSGRRWMAAAAGSCLLSMASKEVAVSVPIAVLLFDRCFVAGSFREAISRRKRFYAALAATWLALAFFVSLSLAERTRYIGVDIGGVTWWRYALTQTGIILHYLKLALIPFPLSIDYSDWPIARGLPDVWPQATTIGALLAGGILCARRFPSIFFTAAWFFMILAPTSSVLVLATEVATERRMYLPLAAIAVLYTVAAGTVLKKRFPGSHLAPSRIRCGEFTLLTISLCFILLAIRRNAEYWDDALWKETLRDRPRNARAHNNFASALAKGARLERSRSHLEKAIASDPLQFLSYHNMGNSYKARGMLALAIANYRKAIEIEPEFGRAHWELAKVFRATGKTGEAILEYNRALMISPKWMRPKLDLAWIYAACPDAGLRDGQKAQDLLQSGPWPPEDELQRLDALAAALAESGRYQEAAGTARLAAALAEERKNPTLAREILERIALYESGQPYRYPYIEE